MSPGRLTTLLPPTYAELFRDTLRNSPLDRAILGAFAEVVNS
ncbi:hypothetical protein [Fodinicola feengrottensis]|nr:hypothetical protein [Fodinicola feengrottensis]